MAISIETLAYILLAILGGLIFIKIFVEPLMLRSKKTIAPASDSKRPNTNPSIEARLRPQISPEDWVAVGENISANLQFARSRWYADAVEQIEKQFPGSNVRNRVLGGEADFAAHIYQLIWTCKFISVRGYVPNDKGQALTDALYAKLIRSHGQTRVHEAITRYRGWQDNMVTEDSGFGSDIAKFMLSSDDPDMFLKGTLIASITAVFREFIFMGIAFAFNDKETVARIEQRLGIK